MVELNRHDMKLTVLALSGTLMVWSPVLAWEVESRRFTLMWIIIGAALAVLFFGTILFDLWIYYRNERREAKSGRSSFRYIWFAGIFLLWLIVALKALKGVLRSR